MAKPTRKFSASKLSQALPIWRQANSDAANLFFKELLKKLGITDIRSYFRVLQIPIVISVILCACMGAASDGLKGFAIGGLLGVAAPIALLWAGAMVIAIALFMAIYVAV